ncbi:oxygen-binding di-iron domain-containing protein [Natronorarus salvus]|uniref:MBL fold metallo-hydrolase n=1 Tax=Natronorarus salvus TaxID=3117733 RepID=UPI002F2698C7
MSVRLTDKVTWIKDCFKSDEGFHQHLNLYLVESSDGTFLIDSGPWNHREKIKAEINNQLNGRDLDAVVLTHADLPHSGNVPHFLEEWGTTELWFTSTNPEMQGFEHIDVHRGILDQKMNIAGHQIEFIPAPLVDRPHTSWMFDFTTDTLYSADAFGCYHTQNQCDLTSDDLDEGLNFNHILNFNRDTFKWLNYAEADRICERIKQDIEKYDPEIIAPSHGHPIYKEDIGNYLSHFEDAVKKIESEYEVGLV